MKSYAVLVTIQRKPNLTRSISEQKVLTRDNEEDLMTDKKVK